MEEPTLSLPNEEIASTQKILDKLNTTSTNTEHRIITYSGIGNIPKEILPENIG